MTSDEAVVNVSVADRSENKTPKASRFPSIGGKWKMRIHWQNGKEFGTVDATALIRQDDTAIDMEVYSTGSDSRTILAQPGCEKSGSPVLHYMYEVEPKTVGTDATSPYKGAAILRLNELTDELSGNYWTSQLTKGRFELRRDTSQPTSKSEVYTVDVLLITALEQEFEAAKKVFSVVTPDHGVNDWRMNRTAEGAEYWVGSFHRDGEPLFQLAMARPSRMGGIVTGPFATALANHLQPKCLVMCGVCAGNPGDLDLGDIVISEMVYQYDEGKRENDGFVGDFRQLPISPQWLAAAQSLNAEDLPSYGKPTADGRKAWLLEKLRLGMKPQSHPARGRYFEGDEWKLTLTELESAKLIATRNGVLKLTAAGRRVAQEACLFEVESPVKLPIAIKSGPFASGNFVAKDGNVWANLKEMGVRSALAVEMEGASIGWVARQCNILNWIVIKGVMDHADLHKADRYKTFAAHASAEALRKFLVGRFIKA